MSLDTNTSLVRQMNRRRNLHKRARGHEPRRIPLSRCRTWPDPGRVRRHRVLLRFRRSVARRSCHFEERSGESQGLIHCSCLLY
jgi:hypothetical protein